MSSLLSTVVFFLFYINFMIFYFMQIFGMVERIWSGLLRGLTLIMEMWLGFMLWLRWLFSFFQFVGGEGFGRRCVILVCSWWGTWEMMDYFNFWSVRDLGEDVLLQLVFGDGFGKVCVISSCGWWGICQKCKAEKINKDLLNLLQCEQGVL